MNTLIRWNQNPARLLGVRDDVDRLFDSLIHTPNAKASAPSAPVDIEETKDEFVLHVDLPGVAPKDVKITLEDDVLTIRGERKQSEEKKDRNLLRVERRYGSFERSFRLGVPVNGNQVEATYRDGVLEIHAPKAEQAKPREIEVRVAS